MLPRREGEGWVDGWYVVPYDVIFRDLDPFGHVNNAVYLTYFEWARTRLWFAINDGAKWGDISFIVARAEIDFRAQIELERIELRVRIGEMRNSSFDTVYEIRSSKGDVAATGRVVVVLYDWETKTKVAIRPELRNRITAFQEA